MTLQTMLIIVGVGLSAGWLASLIMKNGGNGLTGDMMLGVGGGLVGIWLLSQFAIGPRADLVVTLAITVAGAVVLLVAQRMLWQVRT